MLSATGKQFSQFNQFNQFSQFNQLSTTFVYHICLSVFIGFLSPSKNVTSDFRDFRGSGSVIMRKGLNRLKRIQTDQERFIKSQRKGLLKRLVAKA
jgi:hypothetical protein